MGLLTIEQSLIALFFGIAGGVLPDLDSDNSKPIRGVFGIFAITLPLVFILSFKTIFSIVEMLLIWIFSSFILRIVFFKIFLSLTSHRGIFHTIPMGIVLAQMLVLLCSLFFKIDINTSFIYGFFIFFGFFIHLLLDEMYSVNVLGAKIKKSFGTALKLYDKNNKSGTLILYLIIAFLWFILPNSGTLFLSIEQVFGIMKIC